MPIYDYGCQKCGHEFEKEQRIIEDPIKKCPACGAMKAKRLISKTSFVLKGGGWYNDLYASPSDTKKDSSDSDADSGGKGESKSDEPAKADKADKADKSDAKKSKPKSGKKKSAA